MENPYKPPLADLETKTGDSEYAGFWVRFGAMIIDSLLLLLITSPLLYMLYGVAAFTGTKFVQGPGDILISYVFPIMATVLFWKYLAATPGKILLNMKIVSGEHGGAPSTGQFVLRYFAYIPSTLVLFLGFIWVAFDPRKQSWHDKIAKTVVLRTK